MVITLILTTNSEVQWFLNMILCLTFEHALNNEQMNDRRSLKKTLLLWHLTETVPALTSF
jgi:hypothetical protein